MDSWDTTTGLLDDFVFESKEVWFGTNPDYMNGERLLLNMRGPAEVDGETVDDEYILMLSCGDGWEATKGGQAAEQLNGRQMFNRNSAVGRLINRVKELGDEVIDVLKTRGESYEAATWEGLKFHFEREMVSKFKDRNTQEMVEVWQPLPVEFLGEADGKPKAKRSTAKKPAARTRKPRKSLRDEVIEFGADFDDYQEFLDAVLDPDEFAKADDVEADENLYDELLDEEGGIWAEINKED